jgi:hypothetical protein
MQLYVNDFDQNGSIEQILTQYEGEISFPLVLKGTLLKQLPALRKHILNYDAYKDKTLEDLFPKDLLSNSVVLDVHTLETQLFINKGDGKFESSPLPSLIQSSPIYAIHAEKNESNQWQVILGGNQSRIKPEIGINMGSFGWFMVGENAEDLRIASARESGIFIEGEIRDIKNIRTQKGSKLAVIRNNDSLILLDKK